MAQPALDEAGLDMLGGTVAAQHVDTDSRGTSEAELDGMSLSLLDHLEQ